MVNPYQPSKLRQFYSIPWFMDVSLFYLIPIPGVYTILLQMSSYNAVDFFFFLFINFFINNFDREIGVL